ncbi:hypothetical protein [Streptomyces sp. DW26H14]|uniref:hypothetical protein n=1 Tax=Streptomyces sp. DW26H14 TaxID=3435395 RepID=UPI00403DB37D
MIPGNFLSSATESIDPDLSGWTPLLNCTQSRGTGGRNGDGTLVIKSITAGETRARTVSSYPVTPGTLYQTFADASSATVAERIGIRWMSAANAELSTSWSVTTATVSSSWHRIGVAAVAPAGAVAAQVVLSGMTPAAAAVLSTFENVYLGPPVQTAGNLLSFASESFELDLSGWAVEANGTLSRSAPAMQWAVNFYTAGGEVMGLTATASGAASALCVERPPVTPGVDYRAECYLSPPTSTSTVWLELRFYDATGTQLSATRSTLAPTGTGFMRQRASSPAPAGAATCSVAVGMTGATAGQTMRVETVVVIDATGILQDGSVVPYADASFEQGIGSWTRTAGTATIARSTPWGAAAYDGAYALTVSSSAASTNTLASAQYAIEADGTWRAQILVKVTAGAWTIGPAIHWYDSSGASLSVTPAETGSLTADGLWHFVYLDSGVPAGAATASVEITANATAASSTVQIDSVELFPHLPAFQAQATDALGRITLVLRDLPVGDLLRLYRVVDGTQTLVRGPDGWIDGMALTSGQLIVEDYEAPLEVAFTYRAEFYTTSGAADGYRETSETWLSLPDQSDCWIKDPLQPQRNIMLRASVAPDWSRPIETTEYRVRGRRNSVILYDVRGGLTGTVQVWTMDDTDRVGLHFALDSGAPLLFQFWPGVGLEDAYYSVSDVTEARFSPVGSEGRRRWSLTLTQVDAPIGGVSGTAGWTVQDVLSTWDTGLDVSNNYGSVLDLALDQRGA